MHGEDNIKFIISDIINWGKPRRKKKIMNKDSLLLGYKRM
jgi:hypothetical protein